MKLNKLTFFSERLIHTFRFLGTLVARRPWWFIIGPIIFTALTSIGCFKIKIDDDVIKLFGPFGSSYHRNRELILHNFPLSHQEHYDISRETKFISGYGRLLIETLDDGSIFRKHIVDEILKIEKAVESMIITDPKGKKWDYESLCARYYGSCFVNPTIHLAEHLGEILSGKFKIKYPLDLSKDQLQFHYYGATLGGVTLDSKGHVINATKAQLVYFLDNVDPEREALIATWEHSFLDLIDQIPLQYLRVCKLVSSSYRDEFAKIGDHFLPVFFMAGAIMTIFCILACVSLDPAITKPWLGFFGCISSLMGVAAGCGICLMIGISFPTITYGVHFLLLAIGIDDTFIFLAAWRATDPKDSVEKRLAESYEHSAVSVTLTSMTNCASFLACTTMPYLAIRIFGIYAVVCSTLVYIYQLTFMGGLIALTGRLEAAGYHGMFPWIKIKTQPESPSLIEKCICLYKKEERRNIEEKEIRIVGIVFFRDYYGKFLTKKPVKIMILCLFFLHIAISIYGFTQLKTSMQISNFLSYESYGNNFTELELREFSRYSARLQFIIEDPVDYSKKEAQKEFSDLIKDIQESPYVASEPILNEFWLTYYLKFLNHSQGSFIIRGYNTSTKSGFINCLRFQFFRLKQSQRFKNDVYFNANYTEILSSRFVVQMVNITNPVFMIKGYNWITNRLNQFAHKMYFFHPLIILLEAMIGIFQLMITTISFTILVMVIVTLIFMPDSILGLSVSVSLFFIELGILGYMDYWGLSLNALTLFSIILFIGLSVDNTAHILHAFRSSKESCPDKKMRDALGRVGLPIVQGCLSSIVGMVCCSFLPAYVYKVLFKTGVMLLMFSLANSLAVLPVLLSILSGCLGSKNKATEQEVTKPLNPPLIITLQSKSSGI
ncbi:daf-6 [Cordylochernes scorpioides]|uniref:Daf-6 n=1 Tax=Cordylochernes scorpioides TaxID=51811 RepID=A0ABY6KJV6_9ARAC|nr:daf-6 [Cordylochernes scorpioides]